MKRAIPTVFFILVVILVFGNLVSSATVIQTGGEPVKEDSKLKSTFKKIFLSPILWGLLIIIFFIGLVGIGAYFFIKWIIKYFKEQRDIFMMLKRKRIKLARIHKRYSTRHFLRVSKNVPIRLVRKNGNRTEISSPIAYNLIIAMNMDGMKKMFVFPITDLLVIPNKDTIIIHKKDKKGVDVSEIIENIPTAKEIVQFNEGEVLIFAESISDIGEFHVPVLKSTDGKIIDLSLPVYHTLREAIVDNYLYDQTSTFAVVSKKGMEINPFIRTVQKIQDSGQNTETPSGMGSQR